MKKTPTPSNEELRLMALKSYNILDTLPEKELDSITHLAAHICNTPISLVSLIDEKRQWFKSKVGLDISATEREISFCQYAIMGDELFEVTNALEDNRFKTNPLVTKAPEIRFYAGMPLKNKEGHNLGTLCVIDRVPRNLNSEQKEALKTLANQVIAQFELRKLNSILQTHIDNLAEEKIVYLEQEYKKKAIVVDYLMNTINKSTATIEFDLMGNILSANTNYLNLFGYKGEEIIGKHHMIFLKENDAETVEYKNFWEILLKGTFHSGEFKHCKKNGDEIWPSGGYYPIYNEEGNIEKYVKIAHEITDKKKAEEKLKKSEQLLNEAQKLAKIGSWEFDIKTNELNWSNELFNIFEINPLFSENLYVQYRNKFFPDDLALLDSAVKKAIENGEDYIFEHRIRANNLNEKYILSIGKPFKNDLGEVIKLSGTAQDITERKKTEQALKVNEEKYRSFFENSQGIMCTHDIGGKILSINTAGADYIGYSTNELIGKSIEDILSENTKKNFHDYLTTTIEKGVSNGLMKVVHKNGESKICTYKNVLVKNDKNSFIIANAIDITDRISLENELKKSKEIALQAAISKEHFLANMSHEIRTPMNAIIGFTDILINTTLDREQKDFVSSIKSAGQNLMGIINDILDFSKIESKQLEIESLPFNFKENINSLVTLFIPQTKDRKIEFVHKIDTKIPVFIAGDSLRLNQIIINLVNNAIKFTEKGTVKLEIKKLKETTEIITILFTVSDTGIGIPKNKIRTIFERFTQADTATTRKYGGTGLGLSIVKKLVELQNGNIRVESKENIGSQFIFELPFSKMATTELKIIEKTTIYRNDWSGIRILLVEDNVLNQKLAINVLEKFGFNVFLANNGNDAIKKLRKGLYDLVLMDIQMPEKDGYQATKEIREVLKSNIPIIAMTAHSLVGEKEKCIKAGMNDYVSKPFKPNDLLNKITNQINLSREHNDTVIEIDSLQSKKSKNKFDLSYLKQLSGKNKKFELEMLEMFILKAPMDFKALEKAFNKGLYEDIKQSAHKLKSSVSIVGFDKDVERFSKIEILATKKSEIKKIEKLLASLKPDFDLLISELRNEIKKRRKEK